MSTADYRDALTRRMEQIAAASRDEPDNEGAALAALVGALRADIGVVRAELGALRSETGTLTDAVGERVDAVADEVHRTLASARDHDARASAQAAVALEDARGALESRLAALEDALDAMSERIEALSRDGASTTTAKLATLEAGVGELTERVEREGRDNAELVVDRVRDLTGTRLTELEDALHGRLSATLRLRDEELHRELLAAADAAREQAAQDHTAVVALAEVSQQVLAAVAGLSGELASRDDDAAAALAGVQSGVEGTVESVRGQLLSEMTGLRSDVSGEVATLTPRVDELAVAGTATSEAVATLRGDLLARVEQMHAVVADGLVEVTRSLAGSTSTARETDARVGALTSASEDSRRFVEERLAAVTTQADQLRDGLGSRVDELSAAVAAGTVATTEAAETVTGLARASQAHRTDVVRLLEKLRDDVATAGRDLRTELLGTTEGALNALGERFTVLDVTVDERQSDVVERLLGLDDVVARSASATERVAAELADVRAATGAHAEVLAGLRAEWPTRTFEVVEGAKAVAEGVVGEVRREVGAQLQLVRDELARAIGGMQDATAGLSSGTDRLSRAGKLLVAYLEQRDRLMEAERDRVLHEVLDSFAAGLSNRERVALAGRVTDAVSRRRDARDAERYRTAVGAPVPPVIDLPGEVRALEPLPAEEANAAAQARRPPDAPPATGPAGPARPGITTRSANPPRPGPSIPMRVAAVKAGSTGVRSTGVRATGVRAAGVRAAGAAGSSVTVPAPAKTAARRGSPSKPGSSAKAGAPAKAGVPAKAGASAKAGSATLAAPSATSGPNAKGRPAAKASTAVQAPAKTAAPDRAPVSDAPPIPVRTGAPAAAPVTAAQGVKDADPATLVDRSATVEPTKADPERDVEASATDLQAQDAGTETPRSPDGEREGAPGATGERRELPTATSADAGAGAAPVRGRTSPLPPRAARPERRARVDVMPEARSPEVALEAAAPRPEPLTPESSPPEPTTPGAQPVVPGTPPTPTDDPTPGTAPEAAPAPSGPDEDADSASTLSRPRQP